MPDPTASQALGHFVAGSDWRDIPAALRHEAKRSILNHIGCALGTARDPAVLTALRVMRELQRRASGDGVRPGHAAGCDGRGLRQCGGVQPAGL